MAARRNTLLVGAFAVALLPAPARAEEPKAWVEVRSPNLVVVSDAGERRAREIAEEFERFRAAYRAARPEAKLDPEKPLVVLATDEESTLRELLPEYWERKGRTQPSGIFVPSEERYYLGIQIGAYAGQPFHALYHEYVHLLNRLNFRSLPAWLNEGLAEMYATARLVGRTATFGALSAQHLQLLRSADLLPLDEFFAVDFSSPQYTEADRAARFYAQAWALTHLLTYGSDERRAQLPRYQELVARGTSSRDAAAQAFGDFAVLEKELGAYIRARSSVSVTVQIPVADSGALDLRQLSPAESLAVRGDFMLATHRPAEARQHLEEALRLEPKLVVAQETLGRLYLQEEQTDQAFAWLAKAVEGGSQSYLTLYYLAILVAERSEAVADTRRARELLERTVQANQRFAPARAALAGFYAAEPQKLPQALRLAQEAADLEPERHDYVLLVGRILLRMQRFDEATQRGQKALEGAETDDERDEILDFLDTVHRYQLEMETWKRAEEEARKAAEARRQEDARETAARDTEKKPAPLPPRWGAGPRRRVAGSGVEGWISAVACRGPALDLTLNLGPYLLRLHAADSTKMGLTTAGWKPPDDFDPCRDLKGRRALVIYRAVEAKPYAGEILAVEVRK